MYLHTALLPLIYGYINGRNIEIYNDGHHFNSIEKCMPVSVMSSISENLENYSLNLLLLSLTYPTDNAVMH